MYRQFFASSAVPAVAMAVYLMAVPAEAQPGPPPMMGGPPAFRPPAAPMFRPPTAPAPRGGGAPFMAGPAGAQPPGGRFAPPAKLPSGAGPQVLPNVGRWPGFPGGRSALPANFPAGTASRNLPNPGRSPAFPGNNPDRWTTPRTNRDWNHLAAKESGQTAAAKLSDAVSNYSKSYSSGDRGRWGDYDGRYGYDNGRNWYDYLPYAVYFGDGSSGYSSGSSGYVSGYGGSSQSSGSTSDSIASDSSSQPATDTNAATNEEQTWAAAKQCMDMARQAFKSGDYAMAEKQGEEAIRALPGDANLHEFSALCQFAQGDYQGAAATLHPILAAGPGWDWSTVSSFYTGAETYTIQLRALEQYVRQQPNDATGRFVLAYHYFVIGARDPAFNQLQDVVRLQPKDTVSASIVDALKAKNANAEAATAKPAPGL